MWWKTLCITRQNLKKGRLPKQIVSFSGPGPLGLADHPPLIDLFDLKVLDHNLNIGVDAMGPETDFTIEKDWKSGLQVVDKCSP